jgi:hypothetical protein
MDGVKYEKKDICESDSEEDDRNDAFIFVVVELRCDHCRVAGAYYARKNALNYILQTLEEKFWGRYDPEIEVLRNELEFIRIELDSDWGSDCTRLRNNVYKGDDWIGYEIHQTFLDR